MERLWAKLKKTLATENEDKQAVSSNYILTNTHVAIIMSQFFFGGLKQEHKSKC